VGTDVIIAWIDFDRDGRLDAGETQAVATKQWTPITVTGLALTPTFERVRVGRTQELTAQLSPASQGVLVRFEVLSGPNQGDKDAERTNSSGRATGSYRGDGGIGTDLVRAWADLDEDGVLDANEQQATAVVEWLANGDVDAQVREICSNLHRYDHPALPTLCELVLSGRLSQQSTAVISETIIRKANFGTSPRGEIRWQPFKHHHDD